MALTTQEYVLRLIAKERGRQDELHGEHNKNLPAFDFEHIGIIAEELGEASQALQYIKRQSELTEDVYEAYLNELVQTAASACQVVEKLINTYGHGETWQQK